MRALLSLLMVCACLSSAQAQTEQSLISEGQTKPQYLPETEFLDQHQQLQVVGEQVQWLLYSRSMAASELMESAIEQHSGELPKHIFYVADISAMPSLISSLIVLPKLKELPYAVHLDQEGQQTQFIPVKEDQLTAISLHQGQIVSIQYWSDVDQILAVF